MRSKAFSAVPVVQVEADDINLLGIVTYRDIAGVYDDNISVKQVMTQEVEMVSPEMSAAEAADQMLAKEIHHLVVAEEGRTVGLISSADFVRLVSKYRIG